MKRILVIQFRIDRRALLLEEQALKRAFGASTVMLCCKNGLSDCFDWNSPSNEISGFDAVILAGSGELYFDGGHSEEHEGRVLTSRVAHDMVPFAHHLLEYSVPTLGICFGHQLLGHAAGVRVGHSSLQGKTGTHLVSLTEEGKEDDLFRDIPHTFPAQYAHKDVLLERPKEATVLARSGERCHYSALRYGPLMYSVQFHPERRREDCIESASFSGYVPPHVRPEDIFSETRDSEKIISNFSRLVSVG